VPCSPAARSTRCWILEGPQGIGKSTALRTLAGDGFYCDSLLDIRGKDACQTIQGVWLYELSELDALFGREISVVKAFLSRSFDRFRRPYGRAPETIPRSVVFCGTTNQGGYLKDRSGNRRFWIVRCDGILDTAGLASARDMLWAEACQIYRAGEPWHLAPADDARMGEEQAARLEIDPWEDAIAIWTSRRGKRVFAMNELLTAALGLRAHGSKRPPFPLRAARRRPRRRTDP
jgi:putative DNA primase/helicase